MTTSAVYLAAILRSRGPVVLIDADPQATAAEHVGGALSLGFLTTHL